MEINRVCKYCHVNTYIAYDNCSPVYKKSFKFEIYSLDEHYHPVIVDLSKQKQGDAKNP